MGVTVWKIGFIASSGKFLTQDAVGNLLHATGPDMKKKQTFVVQPGVGFVYLISPNGKYLSAGQKGELEAAKSAPGKEEEWTIEALDDGRWALKSSFGYYLGHKGEEVHSFGRSFDADTEKWTIVLGNHPQVFIRHPARTSYLHLEGNSVNANEAIPWGYDALITIGYVAGRYSLQASNGKFLTAGGDLVDTIGDDSKFILVIKDDQVAFKTNTGKYLQASGSQGRVHAKQNEITKNELFILENALPQAALTVSGKAISIKQGDDVKAIHDEAITDKEIFQFEIKRDEENASKWALKTKEGGYLVIKEGALNTSPKQELTNECWITIEWKGAQIALKASNGKYIIRKPNGSLLAVADSIDDTALYNFDIVNRPQIVFKTDFGFVGVKIVQGKEIIQSHAAYADVYFTEVKNGQYAFKFRGRYWKLESDGSISVTGSSPEWFHVELRAHTRLALKAAATGKYLKAEQNGSLKAQSNKADSDAELLHY